MRTKRKSSQGQFDLARLSASQIQSRREILQICHRNKLSHLGSCLSTVDLIDGIYDIKLPDDRFVLSNGHAGTALYAVLKKHDFLTDRQIDRLNIHPDRNARHGIDVSTGSLGQGLPIALGMALAKPGRTVYAVISDGECAEGSIWEALNIASLHGVLNLRIVANVNGWSAYDAVSPARLARKFAAFGFKVVRVNGHNTVEVRQALAAKQTYPTLVFASTTVEQFPFLQGLSAHYYRMTGADYRQALESLV